jgi:hypothetical protein
MLPELLEQDHCQKAGTGPTPGDHMERRRSLADLLAFPASELLADMLDHLPLARNRFQRLGGGLAQLAQPPAAATQARGWSRYDHPLARQMLGKRLASGTLAGEGLHRRGLGHRHLGGDLILGGRTLQLLELQLCLIQNPRCAFRARAIELARQLPDLQLLVSNQGLIIGGLGSGHREFRFRMCCPGRFNDANTARGDQRRLQRFDVVRKGLATRIHALIES